MKKTTIFVIMLVAAMLLGITMAVSAESKDDHWASINNALNELQGALDRGNKKAANSALADVRVKVYAGMKYLTSIGAYDSRAMDIITYATQALTSKDAKYLLTQAHAVNNMIFGTEVTGNEIPVFSGGSHS